MPHPMVQDPVRSQLDARPAHGACRVHDSSSASDGEAHPRGIRLALERVVLGVLTTLVSVNMWTGGPLLALWVGSRVQTAVGQLSMTAVGVTIVMLIIVTFILYKVLALLSARYNAVIGRVMPRQQAAWLKPVSGERRSIE